MAKIYLHTGSNIGDREQNLFKANSAIEKSIGNITCLSNIYETAAWGLKDQDDFLNQALEVITDLEPDEVLKAIQKIENQMGRVRYKKWGRRLIDIDIFIFRKPNHQYFQPDHSPSIFAKKKFCISSFDRVDS